MLLADEQIIGPGSGLQWHGAKFFERVFLPGLPAPALDALLMGNAKEPTPKLVVLAQAADMPHRLNERILDDVQTGLLVMNRLKNINIKRQLIPAKQSVPGCRISGSRLRHGELLAFIHYQHF